MRESGGVEADLAGVIGHVLARRPQAGASVFQPGQARDARRAGDQRLPLRPEAIIDLEHFGQTVFLAAMAVPVHAHMPVDWLLRATERRQRIMKAGLVALHADQQRIASRGSFLKSPF